jgi:hypothetical protein
MGEPSGELDLPEEPLRADLEGDLGAQHLERHLAVVLQVLGEVHGGHAALAQLALDAVAVRQGPGETISGLGHVPSTPPFRSAVRQKAVIVAAAPADPEASDPPRRPASRLEIRRAGGG